MCCTIVGVVAYVTLVALVLVAFDNLVTCLTIVALDLCCLC